MGKICSFCGYTYGFTLSGRSGLQQPQGNELCGNEEHFCNHPEEGFERYRLEHHHVSPDDKKRWQRQVDEHKRKKASWEAEQKKLGHARKISSGRAHHLYQARALQVFDDDMVPRPLIVDRPPSALLRRPGRDSRVAYTGIEYDYLARRGSHARSKLA